MSELKDIAASFGSSEPVFEIKINIHGELEFILKNKYVPHKSDDPIQNLVVDLWRETLNKAEGRFESYVNIDYVYADILHLIQDVLQNISPLKNPKQSILYKWLQERHCDSAGYNGPLSVGFIALYRYIIWNGISGTRDTENPHAKNVLTVLELMREKHEV
jgi:hypothetical protein